MEELKPCPFCGQEDDKRKMLVFEECDLDGCYVKCDSCGACGPVGYPDETYDACDYDACDLANEDAKRKAIRLWGEVGMVKDALLAKLAALKEQQHDMTKCPNCEVCIANLRSDLAAEREKISRIFMEINESMQIIGKALGFPKYGQNDVGAPPDEICTCEHCLYTIAGSAARKIEDLSEMVKRLEAVAEAAEALFKADAWAGTPMDNLRNALRAAGYER